MHLLQLVSKWELSASQKFQHPYLSHVVNMRMCHFGFSVRITMLTLPHHKLSYVYAAHIQPYSVYVDRCVHGDVTIQWHECP